MAASTKRGAETGEEQAPEEGQGELFPQGSLEGDGLSLKQIIKPSHSQQITVRLDGTEVPAPEGGLLDPETEVTLLVTAEAGRFECVPVRAPDESRKIKGWKQRQVLRPVYVERAQGALEALEQRFATLCMVDSERAGELLDRLSARFRENLEV